MGDIRIIEGFDITGKSTFVKEFLSEYDFYYPNHDITDVTVGRNNSWIMGYTLIDYLSQMRNLDDINLVINRGIPSSIVYEKIYNNSEIDPKVIEYYQNSQFFHSKDVSVYYFYHSDREVASTFYYSSLERKRSDNIITAKYDEFETFEDYWRTYLEFHKEYLRSFSILGILPVYCTYDGEYYKFTSYPVSIKE